jgi:hypothetical protein
MSQLIDFYQGTRTDSEGRTLAQIWAFTDREMEAYHDFVQWAFPLQERSQFNPDAPLLTQADIRAFQEDPRLRANLLRSFDRFLAFLGLSLEQNTISPRSDFAGKQWLFTRPNHNWLRITRVLLSLRLLGCGEQSREFYRCLRHLSECGQAQITADTWAYWKEAPFPDQPSQG